MLRHFESYVLGVIKGEKRGFLASTLRLVLLLLSWPFQFFVACRNLAFDRGWLRRYYPPVPVVISIGNIVVGGTGKTPVTLLIAQEFYKDFQIAILSRGYRSPAEKMTVPIVLSRGNGPLQPASLCGDEPFLMSQNLPKAFVFVGRDRHLAADMAAKFGTQLILLDDGMQHRRLARDFEVIVMDAGDPFGQGYFLPRGLLREGTGSLSRASLVVVNHVQDSEAFFAIKKKVQKLSSCPVVGTRMEVAKILNTNGEVVETVKGMKVGIFCGIAHPDYFQKTVTEQGAVIVASAFTADHVSLDTQSLCDFAETCKEKGAKILLCTEKDWVKLGQTNDACLPIAWLNMRLVVVEGKPDWEAFIEKAASDLRRRS